jgi:predicted NAD/FAD-dependent oxidoreductase
MAQQVEVLIVGAGMAGLMAGRTLAERGIRPLVLDKGRNPGGRMATRRMAGGVADHGAQFFTVRDPLFGGMVDRWLEEGLAFEWSRGWSDGSLAATRDGYPRYAINGGMNALAQHLALGMDVRVNVRLAAVRHVDNAWEVEDINGSRQRASAVLLTPPIPQSLELLYEGGFPLPQNIFDTLTAIEYEPCLTGLFHVEGEVALPHPGAIQRPHAPIYWIADNQRKGISPDVKIVTMEASPAYSRQLYDRTDEDILKSFRVDLQPFLSQNSRILEAQLKRWRYSQPMSNYPERCLVLEAPSPLVFAGDAFGEPRVEGAVLSGVAAGEALARLLGK